MKTLQRLIAVGCYLAPAILSLGFGGGPGGRLAAREVKGKDNAEVAALLEKFATEDLNVWSQTRDKLRERVGPDDLPAVVRATRHKHRWVRAGAFELFWNYRDQPDKMVPHLLRGLKHKDALARYCAARASAGFARNSPELLRALILLVEDNEIPDHRDCKKYGYSVASEAVQRLAGIGPNFRVAYPALFRKAKSGPTVVRCRAFESLAYLSRADSAVAEVVVPLLRDTLREKGNDPVRAAAAGALVRIGPRAREAVPELRLLLRSPRGADAEQSDRLRGAALSGLGAIGPGAAAAVPDIVAFLTSRQAPLGVRLSCVDALTAMGPAAKAALPALQSVANGAHAPAKRNETFILRQHAQRGAALLAGPAL